VFYREAKGYIKNQLGWADFRLTNYRHIEKWWELVCSAYCLVSLNANTFSGRRNYTPANQPNPMLEIFSRTLSVEIAARALSPGINDPFTAVRCIDQLSVALCHLAQKEIPSPYRYDDDDKLRVIAEPIAFADLIDAAFNQIRQYGKSSVGVTMRLLEAIATIATFSHRKTDRAALLRHANMINRGSQEAISEELDLKDVEDRYLAAVKALEQ